MTTEERFPRIEHVTAGLAEERRKDREEFRELWRGTQRRLDQLAERLDGLAANTDRFAAEAAARDRRFEERMDRMVAEMAALDRASRVRDDRFGERIGALASATGVTRKHPASPGALGR